MNRQQRRANGLKGKKVTYNLTKDQINDIKNNASADILSRLFILSCTALMNAGASPEFVEDHADEIGRLYYMWENDELDINKLNNDLWEYAGLKFERGEK